MDGDIDPGVSVRFGPVQDKDVKMEDADAQGANKRKSRASIDKKPTYAEPESSEEDEPLVRHTPVLNSMRLPCNVAAVLGFTD